MLCTIIYLTTIQVHRPHILHASIDAPEPDLRDPCTPDIWIYGASRIHPWIENARSRPVESNSILLMLFDHFVVFSDLPLGRQRILSWFFSCDVWTCTSQNWKLNLATRHVPSRFLSCCVSIGVVATKECTSPRTMH